MSNLASSIIKNKAMKKMFAITMLIIACYACGNQNASTTKAPGSETATNGNPDYDPHRGEGKFKKVDIATTIDTKMVEAGNKIYTVKCSACHKLTSEKLVGPGWKGVTKKLTAEWIMNFVTNTDAMLNKDPEAQAQLEICLVRMPNQNVSDDDARNIYEFMRNNDATK